MTHLKNIYLLVAQFFKFWCINGNVLIELSTCLKLQGLPEAAFVPRDASSRAYQTLNYQWNTFNYIEPMAYIVPRKAAHVQGAVICGRSLNTPMVAKSGGHFYAKYSYGTNASVIIDLLRMSSINIDRHGSTATIGPGILVAQLQYCLWKNGNFVTPATVCYTVGFGGAAQGGGYGYLSKKFGLMSDNVLEMEMVTANGRLLKINSAQNQDLYWGLRGGGGGNFGIVTKFKIKIHRTTNFTFNFITLKYPLSQVALVSNAYQKFSLKYLKKSPYVFLIIESVGIKLFIFDVNLSRAKARRLARQFPSTRNGGSRSIKTYTNFLDVVIQDQIYTNLTRTSELRSYKRQDTAHVSVNVKSTFKEKLAGITEVEKLGEVIQRIPDTTQIFIFTMGDAINRIPKNATAFVHRDSLYNIELKYDPTDSSTLEWVQKFDDVIKYFDNGERYQNYVDPTLQDYLQRYYGTNLERLMKIKREVDPFYYFRFPQSIPPSNSILNNI